LFADRPLQFPSLKPFCRGLFRSFPPNKTQKPLTEIIPGQIGNYFFFRFTSFSLFSFLNDFNVIITCTQQFHDANGDLALFPALGNIGHGQYWDE
jgi:hypothetical protein